MRWSFRNASAPLPDAEQLRLWSEQLGVPQLVVKLLHRRGLSSVYEMDRFLSPLLRYLIPPAQWPGFAEAAAVLARAVRSGKQVAVWGDYDVDGVTATALVLQVLNFHGIPVRAHLPDRRREGYGLNIEHVERLAADGVGLLLTVDCGISDVEAVARARELGLTVVISDHHLPPSRLPEADAICNPRIMPQEACPCPHLAGVGVAFFLMAAFNSLLADSGGSRMDMREVLDLTALGTLADMVKLTGQNRILVKNGLLKIAEGRRPGLAELKAVSGYAPGAALNAGQIVFGLAPRINAAGRLGSPDKALDLLCTVDDGPAMHAARELDILNGERRAEEERIFRAALEQAEMFADRAGLVLYGDDWHQGVIGIAASRIAETFYRPVLILCTDRGCLKGSGRSIPEFDLHAGLSRCEDLLIGFGGHRQAAGLRLENSRLDALRNRFDEVVREALGPDPLSPSLVLDDELPFTQASDLAVLKALELLQPFGMGNPEPVFASLPLVVRKRRVFGVNRNHVTLEVREDASGITLQAKAWRSAAQLPESVRGRRIRLAYVPGINAYNGVASVELRIKDWQFL